MNKQDVDSAIEFFDDFLTGQNIEYFSDELKNSFRDALTALKVFRLMMEPSDTVVEAVFNEYGCYGTITAEFALKKAVQKALKEVQGE